MADLMLKKNYDLTEITRLLLEMRENCVPKADNAYEDPNRAEKYDALNAVIDLINNPSMLAQWISVKDRLPESTDLYLINAVHRYNKTDGYRSAQVRLYFKDDDEWHGLPDLYEVTHWMPLPEPPKEETPQKA